ncbi:hypothetical protein GCM10027440_44660 [Nocardiopsis coralliicola]
MRRAHQDTARDNRHPTRPTQHALSPPEPARKRQYTNARPTGPASRRGFGAPAVWRCGPLSAGRGPVPAARRPPPAATGWPCDLADADWATRLPGTGPCEALVRPVRAGGFEPRTAFALTGMPTQPADPPIGPPDRASARHRLPRSRAPTG